MHVRKRDRSTPAALRGWESVFTLWPIHKANVTVIIISTCDIISWISFYSFSWDISIHEWISQICLEFIRYIGSGDVSISFLCFFVSLMFRLCDKRFCDVSPTVEKSMAEVLVHSLWHRQTSTYGLPHIDAPDILKCLTDTLSLTQIKIMPIETGVKYIWTVRLDTGVAQMLGTLIPLWDIREKYRNLILHRL